MASDATLPEMAPVGDPVVDPHAAPSTELVAVRPSRRKPRQRMSLFQMIHAELAIMLFMLGLGLWIAMIVLSVVFPFSGAVDDMNRAGMYITGLAGLTVILIAPSVVTFWKEGSRFSILLSLVLMLAMVGNWLGWLYHFSLPSYIAQLFS